MQRISFSLLFVAAFLLFSDFQCGDCVKVDCDPGLISVQFLSKADASDLFANGTYQRNSLQLFTLASDLTAADYSYQLNGWKSSPNVPAPYFSLDENAIGYIFQFNSTERDTLRITFTMSEGDKCCAGVPVTTFGLFKGDTIFPDASGYLILKK